MLNKTGSKTINFSSTDQNTENSKSGAAGDRSQRFGINNDISKEVLGSGHEESATGPFGASRNPKVKLNTLNTSSKLMSTSEDQSSKI